MNFEILSIISQKIKVVKCRDHVHLRDDLPIQKLILHMANHISVQNLKSLA